MQLELFTRQWAIALTGGIATGKSTLAALLRQRHYLVIDADQLSRSLVAPGSEGLAAVAAHFGPQVIDASGQLDRAAMRQIIFQDETQRAALEAIIHPRLSAATTAELSRAGLLAQPKLWFYEAALIFERGRASDFREVWVTTCPPAVQIARVMKRDHSSRAEAEKILAAQLPQATKVERATRVFDTDLPIASLAQQLDAALAAQESE